MDYDYRYTIKFQTVFTGAGADPTYTLDSFGPNPNENMQLLGIRPSCLYSTAAGKQYIPSLLIGLFAFGLIRNYRTDYNLSAPTPGGSSIVGPPVALTFTVDSKLMSQIFPVDGIQGATSWQSIVVSMINQFGAGGGTTVPNGGTSYSIGDSLVIEIDFFFKVL